MARKSAGVLLYRHRERFVEVFLVHPGGPYWAKKDEGAWSIPKGECEADEDPFDAAKREFREETGVTLEGKFEPLRPITQSGGKIVQAWAVEGDIDASKLCSNSFLIELPRGSGRFHAFPEVDRGEWFTLTTARQKILKGQVGLLDQLQQLFSPLGDG